MSIEHRDIPQKGPIEATIDLSESWDKESMRDLIIEKLKELGIYKPDLLFRGFNGKKIEVVRQNGTDTPDSPVIFCSKESELADEHAMEQSALDFALENKKAGLSVYEGDKLSEVNTGFHSYQYTAKKDTKLKDALIAIFTLE